jgi:DNA polymerase III delta prime subunit
MGPVEVLIMPENAPATDSATRRPVHPFFAQGNRPITPVTDKPVVNDAPSSNENNSVLPSNTTAGDTGDDVTEDTAARRGRRRKADHELNVEDASEKTRPNKRTRNSAGGGDIGNHFIKLDSGGGGENTSGPGSSGAGASAENAQLSVHTAGEGSHGTGNGLEAKPSPNERPITVMDGGVSEPQTAAAYPAKPKKMLQFNPKTGTIGSPPKPKEPRVAAPEAEIGKRVASKRGRKRASKIVRITYGTDQKTRARLGEMINAILYGKTQHPVANVQPQPTPNNKKQLPKATETPAPTSTNTTTHPFFLAQSKINDPAASSSKPKKPSSSPNSARTKHYCATPCSPKKPRVGPASKVPMPQFGVKSLGLKFPGAKLPAWPWQGMVHVRGDENETPAVGTDPLPLAFRKSKGNAVKMLTSESVINLVADSMQLSVMAEAVKNIDTDNFIPPPPELRLPQKHFESGSKLQSRVVPELRTFQPSLQTTQGSYGTMRAPPQLARLFTSISSSLSAFDMSQCETSNWVQKYAPITATEVLQPGQEIFWLRDWLRALMVQAVDTGSTVETDKAKAGSKSKSAGAGKKKRRKKLDGFIVSSEDEGYEWFDESEDDGDWAPSGSRGIFRKTVIRSGNRARGKGGDKTANALVISGPRGCGKTAAVYAVAKELDFEVFEINASSRRNGKDVLEKIGDMTRNHHVQQHQSSEAPDNQDAATEDDTAKDIKSGKQPTMNAFFTAKAKEPKSKQPAKPATKTSQSEVKKEPAKVQRQSLILLEEVDILYEEDKQFWTTLVSLIAQAKRPFIMTCNDETLVPLHTLTLHGIFRLSPPPNDLAVDRLLLIAANEGHSLARRAVEQLYDSRGRDLRATTMDLQYWCQIGVGDRRGGLDWLYPRWPRGVDLDENKEVVRVISQDTYRAGMNLLGRDPVVNPMLSPQLVEEEVLHQAWDSWGFDLGNWPDTPEMISWAEGSGPAIQNPADRLGALCAYDDLAGAMSVADVCSSRSFAAFKEVSCLQSTSGSC